MKSIFKTVLLLGFVLIGAGLSSPSAHAWKVEAGADYPVVAGTMGANFKSNLGFSGAFYADPLIDPKINNFISASYSSLTLQADGRTSYRLVPILVGLEVPGEVTKDLETTFAVAAGATLTYLNIPGANSSSNSVVANFTAQVKPGIQYWITDSIEVYARTPINFMFASNNSLTEIAYTVGVGYKF